MASFGPDYTVGVEQAHRYREVAKRLREKAAHASGPDISRDLEDIAHQYEQLAARVDRRERAWQRRRDQFSGGDMKRTGK